MLLNLIKKGIAHFFADILAYVHDALKEAISLSVKRSKEYHEKAVYVNF